MADVPPGSVCFGSDSTGLSRRILKAGEGQPTTSGNTTPHPVQGTGQAAAAGRRTAVSRVWIRL